MTKPQRPESGRDTPAAPSAEANRMRAEIDRGSTGDKVPATDPAAAPLGTDDEAAGTTPPHGASRDPVVPPNQRMPSGRKKGGDTLDT
ncbi:hypothetical protein A6A40_01740 [Azospirillum humicireducens]|uniref:Uncharacterized protein n=1 Tax=Azospirillum humicireducens TaxID=1226968 RepID=A0A160JDE7_9PROT|nr:hypothetical protein [Azospirillum humicireducens]ANC90725.1 hypothetical protein A6A40_01740 [Azospirillum humicireducens]